jgi:hypothetical protein
MIRTERASCRREIGNRIRPGIEVRQTGRRIAFAASLWIAGTMVTFPAAADESAAASDLHPNGQSIKSEGKPHAFSVQRGSGNKIVDGFSATGGDKIRLAGFGLTRFDAVRRLMRQVGNDTLLNLPGGQQLWIRNTDNSALDGQVFQLELDRRGLVATFEDDFKTFRWRAEGVAPAPVGEGVWRTNFGYAGVQDLGSRSLGSNGEKQIYVDSGFTGTAEKPLGIDPFRATSRGLQIIADKAPENVKPFIWNYPYTSGLITTQYSFSQIYGVFEMRARMPKGRGLWPEFWLLPTNRKWPPEIDVFEILGNDTTILHTNAHSKASGKHSDAPVVIRVPDTSADFHDYAVDWEPDEIRWYFDGTEVARAPTPADMHSPMYMLTNLAVGGNWPGNPDASTQFPAALAIEWIRAYRRNATN